MSLTLDLNSTYGEPPSYLTAFLESGGSNDMTVDGSSTPVTFSYTCTTKKTVVGRMLVFLQGNTGFSAGAYGNITALTNGLDIYIDDVILTNWKTNTDITLEMFDISNAGSVFSAADRFFVGRWSFYKAVNGAYGLSVPNGSQIKAVVNDDLTGLVNHQLKIQGVEFGY